MLSTRTKKAPEKAAESWRVVYWCAVSLLFVWAIWQRLALPLVPIADPDIWGYLAPPLSKLTGGNFEHTYGRNFLYPGFIYLLLAIFRDFRAITIVQHVLGLAAGGIFLLSWRRLRVFVAGSRVSLNVCGLVGTAIYLLASQTARATMELRPEALCGFLLSLNFLFVVQFIVSAFIEQRPRAAFLSGTGIVFSALLLASVRPGFWLAATLGCLLAATFLLQKRSWAPRITYTVVLAAGGALLLWPEHVLSRNDAANKTFLPAMLFAIHADLIRDQMAADLETNSPVPYSRDWLRRMHAALSVEIEKSKVKYPGHYPSLGFDPDYLSFDPTSIITQLREEFGANAESRCQFYRFYYWRTWRKQPLRALAKIGRQWTIFYFPKCPAYTKSKFWRLDDAYERSGAVVSSEPFRKLALAYPPAADFLQRTTALARTAPTSKQPALIRGALIVLARTYSLCLILAMIVSALIFRSGRERSGKLRAFALLTIFCFAFNALASLEPAIVNSLDVYRYVTVQMYAVLFAQLLACWLVLQFARSAKTRG